MNKLHLYMGEGKGKTTASMGLALRAMGRGRQVIVAQFMKSGASGEILSLKDMPLCEVFEMPAPGKFTSRMSTDEREDYAAQLNDRIAQLTERVLQVHPGLTVLDELALCQYLGMAQERTAKALVAAALVSGEVVVTGRYAPEWLMERADYVSEIRKGKHPFDQGVPAREGVEF